MHVFLSGYDRTLGCIPHLRLRWLYLHHYQGKMSNVISTIKAYKFRHKSLTFAHITSIM